MANCYIPSYETMKKAYLDENKPMHRIAKDLNMSVGKVYNLIKKYNIPTRSQKETFTMKGHKLSAEQCKAISKRHKGKKLSEETKRKIGEANKINGIGHKKNRVDGYIAVYFPMHPRSSKDGYIMEHILIMEKLLGRHLYENECVHHKNQNKDDNRAENLMLMTKTEHMRYHMKKRWEEIKNAQ
jgi:hypothetical protein